MFRSKLIWTLICIALIYCAVTALDEHYIGTLVSACIILLLLFIEYKITKKIIVDMSKTFIKDGATVYYSNVLLMAVEAKVEWVTETHVGLDNGMTLPIYKICETFEEADKR